MFTSAVTRNPMTVANRSRGFTLIEVLLVIGIIAALAIAAFVIYPTVKVSREASAAFDSYMATDGAHRSFYANRKTDGMTRATSISAGVADDAMMSSPWGTISPSPSVKDAAGGAACATNCKSFALTFATVPSKQCVRLVNALEPNAARIVVGSPGTDVKNSTTPFSITTASTACNAATTVAIVVYPLN
jgi:prepilin-type N-terminal cleavage/methylation domain-containing protein